MENIQIGDRATGRCVTQGCQYTGTVVEVITPPRYSGTFPLYRLVDTGQHYWGGNPIEPIVEAAERVQR